MHRRDEWKQPSRSLRQGTLLLYGRPMHNFWAVPCPGTEPVFVKREPECRPRDKRARKRDLWCPATVAWIVQAKRTIVVTMGRVRPKGGRENPYLRRFVKPIADFDLVEWQGLKRLERAAPGGQT